MEQFAERLEYFIRRANSTAGRLAQQLAEQRQPIPRRTMYKWLKGDAKRPRYWQDVVKIARALYLNEMEANQLLSAAGYSEIATLRDIASADEQVLLRYWNVPQQAIGDLRHFVGRDVESAELKASLRPGTACCIQGMAGVGKTTLAAHVTRQLHSHFPDGILWARLDAANPMALLDTFARAYGQDVSGFTEWDDRARVVRDLLARKRVLIVLDNVQSDQQLAPFLPVAGACAILITTRHHTLWSARQAYRLQLGPFDEARGESLALFARVLGKSAGSAEVDDLLAIARLVGHLPLAVDIIASRLAHEPGWSVARFRARLQQEKQRLDLLAYGAEAGVRLSFNVSYEALEPDLQSFFVALGAFGGEDFEMTAVAYVTLLDQYTAHEKLSRLYSLSLVQTRSPDRFTLHPLLRDFTREKGLDERVLQRLVHYYMNFAALHETDYEALAQEYSNLEAALAIAWEREVTAALVQGALALYGFWETRGLYETAVHHLRRAQKAAEQLGDNATLAAVLHRLGRLAVRQGKYRRAEALYSQGLDVAFTVEKDELICALQQGLGTLAARRGNLAQAEQWSRQALALARQMGDGRRIFDLLTNLGGMTADRGDLSQAKTRYEEALTWAAQAGGQRSSKRLGILLQNLGRVASDMGDAASAAARYEEAWALADAAQDQERLCGLLDNRGFEAYRRGDYREAARLFERGVKIARRIGSPLFISRHRANQGLLAMHERAFEQGDRYLGEALSLARDIGATWDICLALSRRGELYLLQERWSDAEQMFTEARSLAETAGFQEHLGRARYGLAQVAAGQDAWEMAERYGRESWTVFERMGHRKAIEVSAWLARLPAKEAVAEGDKQR